jgi:hypothetical protein
MEKDEARRASESPMNLRGSHSMNKYHRWLYAANINTRSNT